MKDLSIEVVRRCMNRCLHCSSRSCPGAEETLGLPLLEALSEELGRLSVGRVCLSGGEPLLHPDIVRIVKAMSRRGIEVVIYSSGIVQRKGKAAPISSLLAEQLSEAGLSSVVFNLPAATPQVYDWIMGTTGRFPILLKSIDSMIGAGTRCEAHFVPMRPNLEEIDKVVMLADRLGLARLSFLRLVSHGRAADNRETLELSDGQTRLLVEKLETLRRAHPDLIRVGIPLSPAESPCTSCHAVGGKLYVKFDGSVYGCEAFKYINFVGEKGTSIAPMKLGDASMSQILETSEHLARCVGLIKTYGPGVGGSEPCPVQEYLKHQERGTAK